LTATQPLGDPVDNRFIDMVPGLQFSWRRPRLRALFVSRGVGVAWALVSALALAGGCGTVTCPEPLNDVSGTCEKVDPVVVVDERGAEVCDGVDNDGDDAIDEDWPELGERCGEGAGVGECVEGRFVCASGGRGGVVCEGSVGPVVEVCDGKDNDCDGTPDNGLVEICDGEDNDCDGLIDEGAMSLKSQAFGDHATVAAVDRGFVVTRVVAEQVRVETYDLAGDKTGHHDDIVRPTQEIAFIESASAGPRVLVALGQHAFHVLDVHVDSALIPIIVGSQGLHSDWDQGIDWGVFSPPVHPRVAASPPRFVGYRDLLTFTLSPFSSSDLVELSQPPTVATAIPAQTPFDAAGPFVVWEQQDNVRAGWVLDDGSLLLDIDVARGESPGLAIGPGGPGLVYVQSGALRLSELGGPTLQCAQAGFCNDVVGAPEVSGAAEGPTALGHDDVGDVWFVAAGAQLLVVSRVDGEPVVKQVELRDVSGEPPVRVDVAVSGGVAAFVQTAGNDDSVLTFMGCF